MVVQSLHGNLTDTVARGCSSVFAPVTCLLYVGFKTLKAKEEPAPALVRHTH